MRSDLHICLWICASMCAMCVNPEALPCCVSSSQKHHISAPGSRNTILHTGVVWKLIWLASLSHTQLCCPHFHIHIHSYIMHLLLNQPHTQPHHWTALGWAVLNNFQSIVNIWIHVKCKCADVATTHLYFHQILVDVRVLNACAFMGQVMTVTLLIVSSAGGIQEWFLHLMVPYLLVNAFWKLIQCLSILMLYGKLYNLENWMFNLGSVLTSAVFIRFFQLPN